MTLHLNISTLFPVSQGYEISHCLIFLLNFKNNPITRGYHYTIYSNKCKIYSVNCLQYNINTTYNTSTTNKYQHYLQNLLPKTLQLQLWAHKLIVTLVSSVTSHYIVLHLVTSRASWTSSILIQFIPHSWVISYHNI